MASIDRGAFKSARGRMVFVTLSYSHRYPEDPRACKGHLKAFRKRLPREYGPFAAFWRLGIQQRGAWHFHLILFAGSSVGSVAELRRFISTAWYEITGMVSEGHLRAGTRVEAARKWRQATSYVERYLAKPEEFPEGLRTGRIWGVWNEELLPVRWETVEVSLKDAFRIRRIYRKLASRRGSGSLRRMTVFVRHENVVRLLEFVGKSVAISARIGTSVSDTLMARPFSMAPRPRSATKVYSLIGSCTTPRTTSSAALSSATETQKMGSPCA
jgi:hypothetical protein